PRRFCCRSHGGAHDPVLPCLPALRRGVESNRIRTRSILVGDDRHLCGRRDDSFLPPVSEGRAAVRRADDSCRRRGTDGRGRHPVLQRTRQCAAPPRDSAGARRPFPSSITGRQLTQPRSGYGEGSLDRVCGRFRLKTLPGSPTVPASRLEDARSFAALLTARNAQPATAWQPTLSPRSETARSVTLRFRPSTSIARQLFTRKFSTGRSERAATAAWRLTTQPVE